jgi:hypothetical protein
MFNLEHVFQVKHVNETLHIKNVNEALTSNVAVRLGIRHRKAIFFFPTQEEEKKWKYWPSAVSGRNENRASLIGCCRNWQPASPPGLHPPPFVGGAPLPLLLAPPTGRCACSRHKNVWRCTDTHRRCAA